MPKVHATGTGGGGRRGRSSRVSTSLSEINVVPLVDVMLVLLIIFMVTAPMMQQGLQVNLPQSRRSSAVDSQPVYVTIPATFGRTQRLQFGEDEIGIEAIGERVKQALLRQPIRVPLAGILGVLAYLIAVFSYSIAPVSYAGAVREVSVVFGALTGWWFLNERLGGVRVLGAVIIFVGILVIALFG